MYSRDNFEDLRLIQKGLKIFGIIPRNLLGMYAPKIKISGGIKFYREAEKLINQGANLLGTSKSVNLMVQKKTDLVIQKAKEGGLK
jgi:deoxyribose-phosphate aldolase